jgi:hypothetical protein
VKSSLRVLLREVVDYAGLFPPARLEMQPALGNYLRYRSEEDAWMLGRFVCPCARLGELTSHRDEAAPADAPALRLTVLGRGGDTAAAFLDNLRADLDDVRAVHDCCADRARVECYEARFPPEVLSDRDLSAVIRFVRIVGQNFAEGGVPAMPAFFELPLSPEVERRLDAITGQLCEYGLAAGQPIRREMDVFGRQQEDVHVSPGPCGVAPAGLKLRMGGPDAAAVPGARQTARVICSCLGQGLPLKFTAGLHHPLRRFDAGVRAMTHGFLNVFAAAVLARAAALELDDVQAVLEEQDGREFGFDDEYLCWNEAMASLDEIENVRRRLAVSFGSCSFDEPRENLKALGLL